MSSMTTRHCCAIERSVQVQDTMVACMDGAADGAARTACKDTTAKAALAVTLGKDVSQVTATELNRFMSDAAMGQVHANCWYAATECCLCCPDR